MRIGLIGDVHHEDLALAWGLGALQERNVDCVACVGDIADGHGDLNVCCELLESHGVLTVRGNHDRWFLSGEMRDLPEAAGPDAITPENRQWLAALPVTLDIETPNGRALLCHGMGDSDMTGLTPDDAGYALDSNQPLQRLLAEGRYALVICGHTHRPMQRAIGSLTIVNAGTLHRLYQPCVAVLDVPEMQTEFIPIPPSLVAG